MISIFPGCLPNYDRAHSHVPFLLTVFSFTDHLQRAGPVSSTTIADRITANISSTPAQISITDNCASFRQQHDFLQTICVPQCIFSTFPYARQFHSCNFLSNYKSYSIDRNLQVRRRHNRPVLDEGPRVYANLHSEQASTCFIPNKLHSTAYYKDTSPRIRLTGAYTPHLRISKIVPGLFCFCLGICCGTD